MTYNEKQQENERCT